MGCPLGTLAFAKNGGPSYEQQPKLLKGGYIGIAQGSMSGVIKGDCRSLDYSSYDPNMQDITKSSAPSQNATRTPDGGKLAPPYSPISGLGFRV